MGFLVDDNMVSMIKAFKKIIKNKKDTEKIRDCAVRLFSSKNAQIIEESLL